MLKIIKLKVLLIISLSLFLFVSCGSSIEGTTVEDVPDTANNIAAESAASSDNDHAIPVDVRRLF